MLQVYEKRLQSAVLIFDVEDRYAREIGIRGKHPRPLGTIKYFVLGKIENGVRRDFNRTMELVIKRNLSGYDLFFGQLRLPDGTERAFRQGFLGEGRYVLRLQSDFYQPLERDDIDLPEPRNPYSIDLEPGYAYPFSASIGTHGGGPTLLRGSAYASNGKKVAGVVVETTNGVSRYRTDEAGQWVLVLPEAQSPGNLNVRFSWPDGRVDTTAVSISSGKTATLPQVAFRGRVVNGAGIGIVGAVIRVSGHSGSGISDSDGDWYYYFLHSQENDVVSVTVQLPDGQTLTHSGLEVKPRTIVVVPTFQFP